MIEGQNTFFQHSLLERLDIGGLTDGPTWGLMALAAERYQPTPLTDIALSLCRQLPAPRWLLVDSGVARAPLDEGAMARTAMALRTLQLFGTPAMKTDFDRRIALARTHLAAAKASSNDDMAMQIAGLHWAGGVPDKMRSARQDLDRHATSRWRLGAKPQSHQRPVRHRRNPFCAAGSRPSETLRPRLTRRASNSCCQSVRRRILVCAEPRSQVPAVFPKRFPVRPRPMDFLHRPHPGRSGHSARPPKIKREHPDEN